MRFCFLQQNRIPDMVVSQDLGFVRPASTTHAIHPVFTGKCWNIYISTCYLQTEVVKWVPSNFTTFVRHGHWANHRAIKRIWLSHIDFSCQKPAGKVPKGRHLTHATRQALEVRSQNHRGTAMVISARTDPKSRTTCLILGGEIATVDMEFQKSLIHERRDRQSLTYEPQIFC